MIVLEYLYQSPNISIPLKRPSPIALFRFLLSCWLGDRHVRKNRRHVG